MKLKIKERIEYLISLTPVILAGLIVGSTSIGLTWWVNRNNVYLGGGYVVRETRNERQFYVGTYCGAARICIDKNKDGTLDQVMVNAPVSTYMGGPGYRLMTTTITDEDRVRFERANELYSLYSNSHKK